MKSIVMNRCAIRRDLFSDRGRIKPEKNPRLLYNGALWLFLAGSPLPSVGKNHG